MAFGVTVLTPPVVLKVAYSIFFVSSQSGIFERRSRPGDIFSLLTSSGNSRLANSHQQSHVMTGTSVQLIDRKCRSVPS